MDHCRGVLQERNELIDPALGPSAHQCRQFPVGGQEYLGETISARGVDGEGAQVRLAGATLNPAIADESPQHARHRCRPHPGAAGEGSGGLRTVAVQGVEYRQIAVIEPRSRRNSAVAGGQLAVQGAQFTGSRHSSGRGDLEEGAQLVADDVITVEIAHTYSFTVEQVRAAYTELAKGHVRGKLVIDLS